MSDGEWNVSTGFVFEFAMRTVFGFEGVDKEVDVRGEGTTWWRERWEAKAMKEGGRRRQIVETWKRTELGSFFLKCIYRLNK